MQYADISICFSASECIMPLCNLFLLSLKRCGVMVPASICLRWFDSKPPSPPRPSLFIPTLTFAFSLLLFRPYAWRARVATCAGARRWERRVCWIERRNLLSTLCQLPSALRSPLFAFRSLLSHSFNELIWLDCLSHLTLASSSRSASFDVRR
jgi:hypothetical protein